MTTLMHLDNLDFILGSEVWEKDFDSLLGLVIKDYVVDIWEAQNMTMTYPTLSPEPRKLLGQGGRVDMCQGGKVNYVALAMIMVCSQWHVCYGIGLSICLTLILHDLAF